MTVKLPVVMMVVRKVKGVHVQWVNVRMMMVFLRLDGGSYADFTVTRTKSPFMDSNELCHR
jgi:hypothetical protein